MPRRDPKIPAPWRVVVAERRAEPTLTLLDSRGRRLSTRNRFTGAPLATRKVDPNDPPRAALRHPRQRPQGRLRPSGDDDPPTEPHPTRLPELRDHRLRRRPPRFRAAVLLDAHDPDAQAPPLPSVAASRFISARRAGHGWLVVSGGRSPAERARVLSRLSVARP